MPDRQLIPERSDFHSPEVDEIMGRMPHWILRWGITVMFTIFAGIIVMSCFISAPRTVAGEIILSSDNPSVQLSANASGRVTLLHEPAAASVSEGAPIACIGKYADYERVGRAESYLRQSYGTPAGSVIGWPRIDSLPDGLRNRYTAFRLAYGTVLFERSREDLETGIRSWKTKYLISAPVSGVITVTAGRYVREGEPVAWITPEGSAGIAGRMQVAAGYERIRPGMKVWIRIPVTETDRDRKQQGIVSRVVPIADTESELVYVEFPDGIPQRWYLLLQMRTLHGTAEIVVKQTSLFRKFMPFNSSQP